MAKENIVGTMGILYGGADLTDGGSFKAGTVTTTISGNGNYTGTVIGEYRIVKQSIGSASVKAAAKVYTGSEVKLEGGDITVTIGKNPPLVMGEDYEIVEDSYVKNINKGTASVTIRGIGNYGGTKVVKFKITAKSLKWWYDLLGL